MGKTAGGTIGWLWWLQLVVVIAAEAIGAAGLLFSIWPVIPPVWVLALVFMVVFTGINLVGVRNFGEFEFWFAILKVAAIVIFLLIGAACCSAGCRTSPPPDSQLLATLHPTASVASPPPCSS